jgi:hypothetical protein
VSAVDRGERGTVPPLPMTFATKSALEISNLLSLLYLLATCTL